jgi:transcriptional regulator with XRE-family HTH domain
VESAYLEDLAMSLQALIGERMRNLRETKNLTQEALAALARSDAATLSRIETGKQNLTAETLALYLIALNVTPKEFFGSKLFGKPLTTNPDDPNSINSERLSLEEVGGGCRVHFRSGKHQASIDFPSLDLKKVGEAVLILRRGLRQAAVTPKIAESSQMESGAEVPTMKAFMSAAIAECFLSLVQGNATANPSDVWRYIVSPAFCDPQNHPTSSYGKDLAQSFKRTGGWALERVLVAHYSDFLGQYGIELTKNNANHSLAEMGLAGQIHLDKIDLFILARQGDSMAPLGVLHIKSSLAERRTDDLPAS